MWKLLTGLIADQIYAHLDQEKLLPEEQKGCRKGSRGTNDLLYIDRAVIKEVKSRNKNVAMAWIDYKKAYDMIPHLWIIECLDLLNLVKARIDKSQGDSLCRMCRKVDESIDHIVSGCSKLAQKEYKRRHDNLGKIVHWKLARKCNFEAGDKWYEHEPESVLENEDYKILWDFSIQTDHVIEAWRPDLVVVDKKERSCKIIDFAVPGDSRIEEKEKDKIEKYQDLGRELQKIWNVKVKIIPLVVGSLGAIPKQFGNRLKQIGIAVGTAQVQKTVLLGTARILRKVLEI